MREIVMDVVGHKREGLKASALAVLTGTPPAIVARMVVIKER